MNQAQLQDIIDNIEFGDEVFVVHTKGDGFLLQLQYMEPDVDDPSGPPQLQKARKWYVSSHSTEGEVVQTCLLACITSMEHRARERFKYHGVRLFGPHIAIGSHMDVAADVEHRADTRLPCGCPRSVLSVADGWRPEFGHPSLEQSQCHETNHRKGDPDRVRGTHTHLVMIDDRQDVPADKLAGDREDE